MKIDKLTPYLLISLMFSSWGCAQNERVSSSSDSVGKSIFEGSKRRYVITSAAAECIAVPISSEALLTPARCVASCQPNQGCDLAIFSAFAEEMSLLGLARLALVHPLFDEAREGKIRAYGPSALDYVHSYDIAVVTLDRAAALTDKKLGDPLSGPLDIEGATVSLTSTHPSAVGVSSQSCPLGSALMSDDRLTALNTSDGCDTFTRVDAHISFIRDTLEGTLNQASAYDLGERADLPEDLARALGYSTSPAEPPVEPETDGGLPNGEETGEGEPADSVVEGRSREEEALARAPESCQESADSYCDGGVALSCRNGMFDAFDCESVGWRCDTTGGINGEAACLP